MTDWAVRRMRRGDAAVTETARALADPHGSEIGGLPRAIDPALQPCASPHGSVTEDHLAHAAALRGGDAAVTHPCVSPERECDYPWRAHERSLLTPDDHEEMLESLIAVVEAFELLGAVA